MQITLMDLPSDRVNLLPLTYLKSIADLRIGILTVREKWNHWLEASSGTLTADYLHEKYERPSGPGILINANVLPQKALVDAIKSLSPGTKLVCRDTWIAAHVEKMDEGEQGLKALPYEFFDHEITQLKYCWDLFQRNPEQITSDYSIVTGGRQSQPIVDPHTIQYGKEIFCEEGVTVKAAVLNAEEGPIYLGKDVKVQEGSIVKGPIAMCEGSQLSLGTKARGNITIGPYSKLGGEVSNSVIQGYSNKSHDGYLGSAVIGEWCNIGAGTSNSNLKNNYGSIKMWDFGASRFRDSGLQFCGLIMGDHARCAINTSFNTGTTTGIMANIFGAGFARAYIPSYSWGGSGGFATYQYERAVESAERAMVRRDQRFSEAEKKILKHIFESTATDRTWEKK